MKYPYNVTYIIEGEEAYFVVKSNVLENVVAQGDTLEEALMIFDELEQAWLDSCEEDNLEIPEPKPWKKPLYNIQHSILDRNKKE